MTIALSTPVTGGAQTGFTSPTYTVASDTAPDVNAKQWAVTALGGTQAGVTAHSAAVPFTIAFWRPKILKILQAVTGQLTLLGKREVNSYSFVIRKGVIPLAGQPAQMMVITIKADIPAGADAADPANVRAAFSLAVGALNQQSAGWGDTGTSGIV